MNPKTSTHSDEEFSIKETVTYTLLGVVVLGGSFFLGRSLIRKARADSEEKKSYEEGNEAAFAKQLKMAFDNDMWFGWGTDEAAIRRTLQAVPSKDVFRKVINSYQKLYARSLMKDIQDELTSTEYNEMLAIINAKPVSGNKLLTPALSQNQYLSWAKRLKAAFDITYGPFPGTDEDAIKAVFMEIPTQAAFGQVALAYKKEYNDDLMKDLQSELEFYEIGPMLNIIAKKPKA
jgi:Annexin